MAQDRYSPDLTGRRDGQPSGRRENGDPAESPSPFVRKLQSAAGALPALVEQLPLGLWMWDVASDRWSLSAGWREILGRSSDDLDWSTDALDGLVHPEDRTAGRALRDEAISGRTGRESYHLQQRLAHEDGHWVPVRIRAAVVERDDQGRAVRLVGSMEGLSPDEPGEGEADAPSEAGQAWQILSDVTSDCIWHLKADLSYDYISPAIDSLLGYTTQEFLQTRMTDHFPPEDLRRIESIVSGVLASADRAAFTIEADMRHREGHWVPVEIRGRLALDEQGQMAGLHGTIRDSSERRRAREDLLRRQADLQSAQRLARLGSWSMDTETGRVTWSDEVYRILDWPPSRPIPSLCELAERVHPEDRPAFLSANQRALRLGEGFYVEVRIVLPDGRIRHLADRGEAEVVAGNVVRVYGAIQDITDRKEMEEERRRLDARIQHAQKLESLGVLAGGIAHDFNNLLMSVMGNADLALMELSPSSPARESVEEVKRTASRAADLCRQMLAYSGRGKIVVEPVDLSDVVEEMSSMLLVSVSKHATLQKQFARPLPPVHADVTQLRQVVMNLITNASDAIGPEDGVISISTGACEVSRSELDDAFVSQDLADGLHVFLEVTDTGCGMSPECISRIFDPFFTTKYSGRGLGLAAVLGIVRGHKGAIRVSSTPGRGTSVRVMLPASGRMVLDKIEDLTTADRHQLRGTILLVDDEETVRAVTGRMIRRMGLEVLTASDGRQAVETFARHHEDIDCVVLDLTMPRMDGREAFTEMRKIDPDVCVLLASGYSEQDVAKRFPANRLKGIVQKPFDFETLRRHLESILTS